MKYVRVCLAALVLPLCACPDDDDEVVVRRGTVDEGALTSGVAVSVSGTVGSVTVPFEEAVPDVGDGDFQEEMDGAVSLIVASTANQASADIGVGTPLAPGETPDAPGEFTWELNADRDAATLTFFNETPSGLTLSVGNGYSATFSVAPNDYVDSVSALSFGVTVE